MASRGCVLWPDALLSVCLAGHLHIPLAHPWESGMGSNDPQHRHGPGTAGFSPVEQIVEQASESGDQGFEPEQGALPERLKLGLTIEAIEELISQLPSNAVELCNEANRGKGYPKNKALNGYVNQFWAAQASEKDGLASCERLQRQGHPGVGVATIFVSWFLETPLAVLVDAMREYLRQHPDVPRDTKWWVCDFVIRQASRQLRAEDNDVKKLGHCVRSVGHTVLLMEPWNDPQPLRRAYCIKEVYHTQASGARFDVVMSAAQQASFEKALLDDFDSITAGLSRVDVRTCTCRKADDTKAILAELERDVGLVECNKLVIGLLRNALASQGHAALAQLPAAERGTSRLINQLGVLLEN